MKVYTICNNCHQEISKRAFVSDRVSWAKNKGEYQIVTCTNCNQKNKYHVNDFKARPSKIAFILAGIIFVLGTTVVFYNVIHPFWGGNIMGYYLLPIITLIVIPSIVYSQILKDDRKRVSSFNRHYL